MYLSAGAAVLIGGGLLLWLLGLRTPPQQWEVLAGGGFSAAPRPETRIVLGAVLLIGAPLAALSYLSPSGGAEGSPMLVLGCFYVLLELVRSSGGPVVVTPAGLSLGSRLYAWEDVHLAYLMGKNV